jgi:carboxyl-terminal processing protease
MHASSRLNRVLWSLAAVALAFAAGHFIARLDTPGSRDLAIFPNTELHRQVELFREVLQLTNRNYVDAERVGLRTLTESALEGMLSKLDPHTSFMPASQFDRMQSDARQEYGGIGVQVELREGKLTIIAPIRGSPGYRAGLARGDIILKVDGDSLEGLGIDEMISRLRGRAGSQVVVQVMRPSTGETKTYELTRGRIETHSVFGTQILEPGIGYVAISNFYERTGAEFEEAIAQLERDGARALILDLRNNPGGLLTAAIEVAGIFIPRGELVVYTEGRNARSRQNLVSNNRAPPRTLPVAILMNSGSASASEIVAGALQDTGRAFVVGEKSFGKGLVQTLLPLRSGDGLRLTTSQYFTPKGRRIHGIGVIPDIEVVIPVEEEAQGRLWRSRRDTLSASEFEELYGFTPAEDRQLDAALERLRARLAPNAAQD